MRNKLIAISVALLLSGGSATAALPRTRAQETVQKIAQKEPVRSSVWGVFAVNMRGDTLVNVNSRQKMVPASNVKVLTTGLALRTFGPDFRFETKLGYEGEIKDSTLVGDLYIIGGGDPTTGSDSEYADKAAVTFSRWTKILKNAGISRIEGRVIGDPRYFDDATPENLSWSYEDLGTYYGAAPCGLNFYENAQDFYVTPGTSVGAAPYVRPRYPDTPWMSFSNLAVTSKAHSSNDLYFVNSEFGPYGEVRGRFPIDRRGYTLECSNRYGAFTCAYYFFKYLSSNGISISEGFADVDRSGRVRTDPGNVVSGLPAAPVGSLTILGTASSPRLADILKEANMQSNNFYAEALMKVLGRTLHHSAVYDSCRVAVEDIFKEMGLVTKNSCQMYDGSGLGRKSYVSPAFFVSFLKQMAESGYFEDYFNSLPQPGRKGTLEMILRNEPSEYKERIHAKTGSMNGVRCVSGYILSKDGDPSGTIVFSLMMNNLTVRMPVVTPVVEEVLAALLDEN